MSDLGKLVLRLVLGTIMLGHGTQKMFGWFNGPGLKGVQGFMESLGMRPGHVWGTMASGGETTGGLLTALGFLSPLGPLNIAAAMMVAMRKVHWSKGFWNNEGGVEFPLVNMAAASSLAMLGPGKYSLDRMLGIRIPRVLSALMWLATIGTVAVALIRPELAEKAMNMVPGTQPAANQPDLEVESRPIPQEEHVTA